MQVIAIVPLDKRRCKVRTDAGFAFALYKGEIRKFKIEAGEELTEETYGVILKTVLIRRARERALYFLRSHDRTEQEIRRKLREGGYPDAAIDPAVAFLQEYGYVNDMEYGRRYVELYGRCRSQKRIREELIRKGLDREQIEELLQGEEVSEAEQIQAFLDRKGYDAEEWDPEKRQKLTASLLRKGYSYEAVRHAVGK